MNRRPQDEPHDLDRTDTLPMLVLEADDTGTLAVPQLPELEPSRRVRVEEDLFSVTDTFSAAPLATPHATPIAAIPVGIPDLAESLREREVRLVETGRRVQELDAQLAQADERCAELEGQLEQAERRCEELERQCALLREAPPSESEPPARAIAPPGLLDELVSLQRTNGLLHESISSLHGRLGIYEAMLAEAEEALRNSTAAVAGAAAVSNVVDQAAPATTPPAAIAEPPMLVDWPARYAELEMMLESERSIMAARLEEQAGRLAAWQAHADAARTTAAATAYSRPAQDTGTAMRVLIRLENGTESIYPLGRRTTIGRTPDNDIQINTTFVSRHHAALLSSAGECIIEDLNSTNGLLVNGQRAGRQILQHGDILTFGKTRFRYETRA